MATKKTMHMHCRHALECAFYRIVFWSNKATVVDNFISNDIVSCCTGAG